MKPEGAQVDCAGDLTASGYDFGDISLCKDLLVGPSAALSNGYIADGRIKYGIQFGRLRNSRNLQKNRARVVRF